MEKIPKLIYKYKGISTKEDLVRLVDIIKNHRIYLPHYYELNDPLEGQVINITPDGYPGYSIPLNADEEDNYIKSYKESYRILSLAEQHDNPQLWAHYSNNYDGVCLCFSTQNTFHMIKKVEYCEKREDVYTEGNDELERCVERSLFKKNIGWNYEKEWRYISHNKDCFLKFGKEELLGMIIGHNVSKEVTDFLLKVSGRNIMKMKTSIGYRTYKINVLPMNYKYDYDGSPLKVLDVEKTLLSGEKVFHSIFDL